MSDQVVLYEERDRVAIITLNRPGKNLFSDEVVQRLHDSLCQLNAGSALAGVICANGENFTMGADLHGFPKDIARSIPGAGAPSGKPLVAAVNGWCLGAAMTLVQMCDLCVATETTRFMYPEAKLGVSMGMIAGLAARIPHKVAMEVMLLGGVLPARRAYEVGLVNRLVPEGEQLNAALEYARALADNSPLVIARLRRLVNAVVPDSPAVEAYRMQKELSFMLESDDLKEGMGSITQKRKANFVGR
ncbi:enoyl-CoA hydratase-related protein [Cupriavidus sp. CV2]|uniref:enoyl-CoA hydratase/isomerase family protein n=2 Tax=Cupriavidus TaxID=106589 RepID=UPI00296B47E3|nr:enoyl-CoA hydratase-related protein [Cupriavidus sp. CV2]MDW3684102.1 enoyl-CoA hydratase-related protein [Cupriavidus sp. CV2]